MKLAVQDGLLPGRSLAEKLDNAARYGFDGIELGGGWLLEHGDEVVRALENHPVKVSSICSGYRGCLLDPVKAERDKAVGDMEKLLQLGGRIGATGLIFVPVFGGPRLLDLSPYRTAIDLEHELLADLLDRLSDTAEKSKCLLLLEPLNRYETHMINRLEQAVAVAKRVKRKGLAVMADLFHMSIEEDDLSSAICGAGKLIRHVHLADSQRLQPGTGHTDFRGAFRALKESGFSGYMALECGVRGPAATALPACVKFMRKQMR
ncbi:MAG: sugar phosphate isomerase/epimerase [Candidatus Hydrogenedentes bacterium]|nr:sugar phosphate isomerase/epimerase [Candidatus Hydrogenedentota bacterium]